ncbi:MAG: glycosyltransferase family 2 protein [Planctomycetota bacterium]|jgi:hypothetical protein
MSRAAPAAGPVPGLSVTIVCCNNESTIGRTLESVRDLAEEVVAVDSGSTDGTLARLEAAGARIIHQPWLGFVKQKQFALEQCVGAWVLHLDSDESIDAEMAASIRATIARDDPAVAGGWCNRMTHYAGHPLRHVWQPEWRLRLVRRERARWGGIDPHDELMVDGGRTLRLEGSMRHDAISSAADMLARQVSHARVSAAALHAAGRRGSVLQLIISPPAAWLKQVVGRRGFLDGWRGLVAASITAAAALMKHAILLEHSRQDAGGSPDA